MAYEASAQSAILNTYDQVRNTFIAAFFHCHSGLFIAGTDGSTQFMMTEATEAQLAACVRQSLDAFLYQNAVFMCERLYAEFHNEVQTFSINVAQTMRELSKHAFLEIQ